MDNLTNLLNNDTLLSTELITYNKLFFPAINNIANCIDGTDQRNFSVKFCYNISATRHKRRDEADLYYSL